MCEKKGVGQGVLWVMIEEYIYKTTRSGQENKRGKERIEESVCCDQDGFGLYESRCVAFSGFTKGP